jgi:hypothetical protein
MTALMQIPLGVVVARRKAASPWIDYTWQPQSVLVGLPDAAPWTLLSDDGETATFYAGSAVLDLHRLETANYRENLFGDVALWVVLQPTGREPPYELVKVTADPSEGEVYTEAGAAIVDMVPMPDGIRDILAAFVEQHHVEQPFFKRQRTPAEPEALARRGPLQDNKPHGQKS